MHVEAEINRVRERRYDLESATGSKKYSTYSDINKLKEKAMALDRNAQMLKGAQALRLKPKAKVNTEQAMRSKFTAAKHAYLGSINQHMGDYLYELSLHRQSQQEVHSLALELARLKEGSKNDASDLIHKIAQAKVFMAEKRESLTDKVMASEIRDQKKISAQFRSFPSPAPALVAATAPPPGIPHLLSDHYGEDIHERPHLPIENYYTHNQKMQQRQTPELTRVRPPSGINNSVQPALRSFQAQQEAQQQHPPPSQYPPTSNMMSSVQNPYFPVPQPCYMPMPYMMPQYIPMPIPMMMPYPGYPGFSHPSMAFPPPPYPWMAPATAQPAAMQYNAGSMPQAWQQTYPTVQSPYPCVTPNAMESNYSTMTQSGVQLPATLQSQVPAETYPVSHPKAMPSAASADSIGTHSGAPLPSSYPKPKPISGSPAVHQSRTAGTASIARLTSSLAAPGSSITTQSESAPSVTSAAEGSMHSQGISDTSALKLSQPSLHIKKTQPAPSLPIQTSGSTPFSAASSLSSALSSSSPSRFASGHMDAPLMGPRAHLKPSVAAQDPKPASTSQHGPMNNSSTNKHYNFDDGSQKAAQGAQGNLLESTSSSLLASNEDSFHTSHSTDFATLSFSIALKDPLAPPGPPGTGPDVNAPSSGTSNSEDLIAPRIAALTVEQSTPSTEQRHSQKNTVMNEGLVMPECTKDEKSTVQERTGVTSGAEEKAVAVDGGLHNKVLFTIQESPNGSISSNDMGSSVGKSISVWGRSLIGSEVPSSRDDTPDKQAEESSVRQSGRLSTKLDGGRTGVEEEKSAEDRVMSLEHLNTNSEPASRVQEKVEASSSTFKSKANLNSTFDAEAGEEKQRGVTQVTLNGNEDLEHKTHGLPISSQSGQQLGEAAGADQSSGSAAEQQLRSWPSLLRDDSPLTGSTVFTTGLKDQHTVQLPPGLTEVHEVLTVHSSSKRSSEVNSDSSWPEPSLEMSPSPMKPSKPLISTLGRSKADKGADGSASAPDLVAEKLDAAADALTRMAFMQPAKRASSKSLKAPPPLLLNVDLSAPIHRSLGSNNSPSNKHSSSTGLSSASQSFQHSGDLNASSPTASSKRSAPFSAPGTALPPSGRTASSMIISSSSVRSSMLQQGGLLASSSGSYQRSSSMVQSRSGGLHGSLSPDKGVFASSLQTSGSARLSNLNTVGSTSLSRQASQAPTISGIISKALGNSDGFGGSDSSSDDVMENSMVGYSLDFASVSFGHESSRLSGAGAKLSVAGGQRSTGTVGSALSLMPRTAASGQVLAGRRGGGSDMKGLSLPSGRVSSSSRATDFNDDF
ncbi:hypothetical protein CEUSTIGMA_g8213.t1 [Chlamydomonas eustigma]|uniref:Uncharacterized protein n=1 Tax=Chlamydomonas eustigma TaxID=1157962 RepID=A0A250XCE7_9CHLO|nr:hypothetical protein CEUSTIGMA_g8213.t1 [Chlamydomonas eustigma]|eukprot:GAX80777.1 hypothetical protein CEUSTIGMA_g8213.t1 [Chlamydomonas eustigma]